MVNFMSDKKRKVDVFAASGLAARLKARREAIEAGDLAGAQEAYIRGNYSSKRRTGKTKRYNKSIKR